VEESVPRAARRAVVVWLPLHGLFDEGGGLHRGGSRTGEGDNLRLLQHRDPSYFATMRIPLLVDIMYRADTDKTPRVA